ncbi:MAG: SDR family NAD(P)-dependent oxidoreductase, partial [Bacillales bacterium]|nr:SDR family NAD(P)-dependent oxidoreductase [Bacillales bacterium]
MKYALITGASGGLASASIKYLLSTNEYFVFALDIKEDVINNKENYLGIVCDITDEESVIEAFKIVSTITKTIDIVVNFAGIIIIGSLIETEIKDI